MKATIKLEDWTEINWEWKDGVFKEKEKYTNEWLEIDLLGYTRKEFAIETKLEWYAFLIYKKIRAIQSIRQRREKNDWFVPIWGADIIKHTISYDHNRNGGLYSYKVYYIQYQNILPYFSTEELAKKCIVECEKELKIYFDVPNEK